MMLEGLTAIRDGEGHHRGRYGVDYTGKTFPRAEHRIVRTHPVTEKKSPFVNRLFTTRIVGLRKNESDAILEMLYRHVETPEFSVRFKWQANSISFWGNRCAQHHALWDYYPTKSSGARFTICGDKPYCRAASAQACAVGEQPDSKFQAETPRAAPCRGRA